MAIIDLHQKSLATSTTLSRYWNADMITPHDVITILNEANVSFVLVGAYGLAGWLNEPRATEDVDVVVAAKQVKKAVRVLLKTFPHLQEVDLPVVVRLQERDSENVVIDVMKPLQQPYREVFKNTKTISAEGQEYRVPSLEMAAVMKFSAMTSLYRAPKDKYQDAHDFINIITNNPDFDKEKMAELASLIYPEGGKDILDYAQRALTGNTLPL